MSDPQAIAAGLTDALPVLDKMIEKRRDWIRNCDATMALLQPEKDKFDARTEPHNVYVVRLYVDHLSERRTHLKELEALIAVRSILQEQENEG